MSYNLKLIKIGNSYGFIMPKEIIAEMKITKGDEVIASPAVGGFRISTYDYKFSKQVELLEQIRKYRKNALRELAQIEIN